MGQGNEARKGWCCGSCAAKRNTITGYETAALNAGDKATARRLLEIGERLVQACKAPKAHDGREYVSAASDLFLVSTFARQPEVA